jgi:hypothetical protein
VSNGGLSKNREEAARLYKLAAAQGVTDPNAKVAPSQVAQAAYDYLQEHYQGITTYDDNICHLRYVFSLRADFNLKYDFNAADIQVESVKSVSTKEGIGWPGIELNAASGKHFKAEGSLGIFGSLAPATTSIKLTAFRQPDDVIIRALVKLATECGAKALPF